eukprot:scaffold1298_cov257-Pinguiococcus_pyrenoidosus.AAC.1
MQSVPPIHSSSSPCSRQSTKRRRTTRALSGQSRRRPCAYCKALEKSSRRGAPDLAVRLHESREAWCIVWPW